MVRKMMGKKVSTVGYIIGRMMYYFPTANRP